MNHYIFGGKAKIPFKLWLFVFVVCDISGLYESKTAFFILISHPVDWLHVW